MTDTDKINEEIRNYKLFKVQRLNTKVQKYSEILAEIKQFKKTNFINNILSYFNFIAPIIILYLLFNYKNDINGNYEGFLYLMLFIFTANSIHQSYLNIILRKKFSSFEDQILETVDHYKSESEKQINNYEFFVEELHDERLRLKKFK